MAPPVGGAGAVSRAILVGGAAVADRWGHAWQRWAAFMATTVERPPDNRHRFSNERCPIGAGCSEAGGCQIGRSAVSRRWRPAAVPRKAVGAERPVPGTCLVCLGCC